MYDVIGVKYRTEPLYKDYTYLIDNTVNNIGFSKANNDMIARSENDVILLNPDCYPIENAFEEMERLAYRYPAIGIVQPRMVKANGEIDSTGHIWTKGRFGIPIFGDRKEESLHYWDLPSACFGCVYIKRSLINAIGLLDEKFFLYFEDIDYSIRAIKKEWEIKYCPSATVIHERHGTSGGKPKDDIALQSYLYLLKKHFKFRYILKRLAIVYMDLKK